LESSNNYFSKLEIICEMAVYLDHITLCQFKTATDAVHWLTQKFPFRKAPTSIANMTVNHSKFITVFLENIHTSHYHWLRDTSDLLEATECTVNWKILYAQNILVFFLMCELNVTVKLYRAACRLMLKLISTQIRKIRFHALFLMSVPLHKVT